MVLISWRKKLEFSLELTSFAMFKSCIYFHLIILNCWTLVKTSSGAWSNVAFFSWWQTTFYWVTSKLVSTPLQNDEREMHHAMIQRVDLFLYAPQYEIMLSAGNIFNPQLLFTMIWFTCKVSFQHNSNNFDTFTVICKSMVIIISMFFWTIFLTPFLVLFLFIVSNLW